ncbi:MAG: helix-turn-helix transcriptional regulator, partial [Gammaproteobacteria bacterium]|nr:helix-turn-helix transcriptional regulator [Gammaproteobacteria bacterium]
MNSLKGAGTILKERRLDAGLTQSEVAEKVRNMKRVGLSEPHYRRIEKGTNVPSVQLALDIADVVDCDVYEIWG